MPAAAQMRLRLPPSQPRSPRTPAAAMLKRSPARPLAAPRRATRPRRSRLPRCPAQPLSLAPPGRGRGPAAAPGPAPFLDRVRAGGDRGAAAGPRPAAAVVPAGHGEWTREAAGPLEILLAPLHPAIHAGVRVPLVPRRERPAGLR